ALAACSPQGQDAAEGPPIAAKRMPLPDCADVALDSGAAPDCRIQSTDKAGLAFEARRSEEGGVTTETIAVVGPGDATLQTIEESVEASAAPPHLEDIDADGRDELMIPLSTGNMNTTFAVWRSVGDEAAFARLGELSGVSFSATEDGALAVASRSSASEWVVEYYRINGETLNALARAVVAAEAVDGAAMKTTCVAEDAGAMTALGLTPDEVQTKYCEDPAALNIFE
ncbi:MAG: hypothetical protein ABL957_14830, partial [Parvularculaceae bacterium]